MINDGIEAYIKRVVRRSRYMEYVQPGHVPVFKTNSMHCYIEAATDEQFEVHVKLPANFLWYTATGIQVRLWLDAHEEPDVYFHHKAHVPAGASHYVLRDFMVQVGDVWQNGMLSFGDVEIDNGKTKTMKNSELAERSRKLGTIRVSVQRGRQDNDIVVPEEPESAPLDSHVTSNEKLGGVTHHVKTIRPKVIPAPHSDTSTRFRPITGKHGEILKFEFRYRSRAELQNLGMMDAEGNRIDPTVEPELATTLPDMEPLDLPQPDSSSSKTSLPLILRANRGPAGSAASPGLFVSPNTTYTGSSPAMEAAARPEKKPAPAKLSSLFTNTAASLPRRGTKRALSPSVPVRVSGAPAKKRLAHIDLTSSLSPSPPSSTITSHARPRETAANKLPPPWAPKSSPPAQERTTPVLSPTSTPPIPTIKSSPAPNASSLTEKQVRLEIRRAEMQQKQYEIQHRQLEAEARQLDYEILLEQMQSQGRGGGSGSPAAD